MCGLLLKESSRWRKKKQHNWDPSSLKIKCICSRKDVLLGFFLVFFTAVTRMKMGSQSNTEWGHSAAARHCLSTMLKCYYRCNCTVFLIAVTFTHNHHCPLMLLVSLSCSSMTLLTLKLMISQGHLLSYELNAHLSFLCFSASRGRVRCHVNLEGFWEGQRYKETQRNARKCTDTLNPEASFLSQMVCRTWGYHLLKGPSIFPQPSSSTFFLSSVLEHKWSPLLNKWLMIHTWIMYVFLS